MRAGSAVPLAWAPLPTMGSVWRERRRQYAKRTVRVVAAEDFGFVAIETITTTSGEPPKRPVRSYVRRTLWHYTFEEVAIDKAAADG